MKLPTHEQRWPATEEPPWNGQQKNYRWWGWGGVGGGELKPVYAHEISLFILTQLQIAIICADRIGVLDVICVKYSEAHIITSTEYKIQRAEWQLDWPQSPVTK